MSEMNISDAEWDVMEVVWKTGETTAAQVIAELAEIKDWNHRTIRTLLARLVEKGALKAESDGNRYVYRALASRSQCVRHESATFLEKVFGGDVGSLLAHFVQDPHVSPDDLEQLRKILNEADTKQKKR